MGSGKELADKGVWGEVVECCEQILIHHSFIILYQYEWRHVLEQTIRQWLNSGTPSVRRSTIGLYNGK